MGACSLSIDTLRSRPISKPIQNEERPGLVCVFESVVDPSHVHRQLGLGVAALPSLRFLDPMTLVMQTSSMCGISASSSNNAVTTSLLECPFSAATSWPCLTQGALKWAEPVVAIPATRTSR